MKKKTKHKPLPHFHNAAEEWTFWQTHDSTDYVDYSKENRVTIEFDPSVEAPVKLISIRLPRELLNRLRAMAAKMDIPYQSYIKMVLAEKVGIR